LISQNFTFEKFKELPDIKRGKIREEEDDSGWHIVDFNYDVSAVTIEKTKDGHAEIVGNIEIWNDVDIWYYSVEIEDLEKEFACAPTE